MSEALLPFVEVCTQPNPTACVIWMHGLGDSGHGFAPIVKELKLPENLAVRFLFPHAPERPVTINNGMRMRAWYDIKSLDFNSRADLAGVQESAAEISKLVENQINQGIAAENIVLGGFSQGGVIALHLGTRIEHKLAGIMALSTYMCEPEKLAEEACEINKATPIMMAHGDRDEVVPHFLGNAAYKTLTANGFSGATWTTYNMQHNVCYQEIQDIASWIEKVFS